MNVKPQSDEEPEEPEEPKAAPPEDGDDSKSKGKRRSYRGVRRELSDEELKSPVVQKTLLDEIDRLDAEIEEAKAYRERFHTVDKSEAVLREKFTVHTGYEVASTALVTGGGILLGFVSSIWDNQPTAAVLLAVGSLAVISGVFMKKIRIKP